MENLILYQLKDMFLLFGFRQGENIGKQLKRPHITLHLPLGLCELWMIIVQSSFRWPLKVVFLSKVVLYDYFEVKKKKKPETRL